MLFSHTGGGGEFRLARAEAKPRRPALNEQGGGAERQFRSKKVRAFSNKGHQKGKVKESRFASLRSATKS